MSVKHAGLALVGLVLLTSCSAVHLLTPFKMTSGLIQNKDSSDVSGDGLTRGLGTSLPLTPTDLPTPTPTPPGGFGQSEGGLRTLQAAPLRMSAVYALRLVMRIEPGFVRLGQIGDTRQLRLTVQDSQGTPVDPATLPIIWHSSNPAAVTVDLQGNVTLQGNGFATISAYLATNPATQASAGVSNGQPGISITPGNVQFTRLGQQQPLQAEVRDGDGNLLRDVAIAWRTSQPGVATVNAQGLLTMTGNGFTTITATLVSNPTIQASIPVNSGGLRVQVQPGQLAYTQVGQQQQLQATIQDANGQPVSAQSAGLYWYSSDPTVATVSQTGLVQVVGNGTALITAAVSADPQATASAWVSPSRPTLRLLPTHYTFNTIGEQTQFQAQLYDANNQVINTGPLSLNWSSSAPGIASVNSQGVATMVSAGFAIISASLSGDPSVTASAQVSFQTSSSGGGGGSGGGSSGGGSGGSGTPSDGGTLDTILDFN